MMLEQLLDELEALSYSSRYSRMIELGRLASTDASIATALARMEQGDFYERLLTLQACFGSRNASYVLRSLNDPSRIIRGLAIKLACQVCNETQIREALTSIPVDCRHALLWKAYKVGYQTAIDTFLDSLAQKSEPQLGKFLPFGSPAIVMRYAQQAMQEAKEFVWRRLARLHPTIAFDLLQARADTASSYDPQLVYIVNMVLPILARQEPDRTIALITTLSRHVPLGRLSLQPLVQKRPATMAEMVLQANELVNVHFRQVAHQLEMEQILALIQRNYLNYLNYPYEHPYFNLFKHCKPEQRSRIYAAIDLSLDESADNLRLGLIALLPRLQREQEGRRYLALPRLAAHPQKRLVFAQFLPWDEAHSFLAPLMHNPDVDLRARALSTLVSVVRYQRDRLPELLAIIHKHRYEPDNVRSLMLKNLAALPQSIWYSEHTDNLTQIVRYALDATDISEHTFAWLTDLVIVTLPHIPQWSAAQLAMIVQAHGTFYSYIELEHRLSYMDVRQIASVLQPVLASWVTHGNEIALQKLTHSFRTKLASFDELLDILEQVLQHTISPSFADSVLPWIIKYRPDRAVRLIPALLQDDPTWITRPDIYSYLHRYRQDLLTPFLGQQAYSGRFHTGQTYIVLPFQRGIERWTRLQQTIFAEMLTEVIKDDTNAQSLITASIAQLAAIPAIPVTYLARWANDSRPVIRDTALLMLSRLDSGEGIPILLEALQDERARKAIYVLGQHLHMAPINPTLALLRQVPLNKITIAKEVVRLLGNLPYEEAYQELLMLDKQELHRDVRVALLRVLWNHLNQPETWHILEREAQSPDIVVALSTAHMNLAIDLRKQRRLRHTVYAKNNYGIHSGPAGNRAYEWTKLSVERLPAHRFSAEELQRMMRLFAILLDHPSSEVRIAVLRDCQRIASADHDQALLSQLLAAMNADSLDVCQMAASAVFGTCIAEDAASIGSAIEHIQANRHVLQKVIQVLEYALTENQRQLLPVARTVLDALSTDPITVNLRVGLAISALPWDEVATFLEQIVATGELHADALHQACHTFGQVADRPDADKLTSLETRLAASTDERLRRIALAVLVAQAQPPHGWDALRRTRLREYQADPSPLVATAAQFTFLPDNALAL